MVKKIMDTVKSSNRDVMFFMLASIFMGVGQSVDGATLSNFLRDRFQLEILQRSWLEFPRELPGFLVFVIIGFLYVFGDIRIAAIANVLAAVGMFCLGIVPFNYALIILCLFIYNMGTHIYMPLSNSIGMSFATDGNLGKKLGQISSANTAALVVSSAILWGLFQFIHISYTQSFSIGAIAFLFAACAIFFMKPSQTVKNRKRFLFRKEYRLFYWLSVLFGARKQIFITFGPWVLVSVFKLPVTTMTIFFFIFSVLGIFFKPLVGRMIDSLGERFVLALEAVCLIFVCLGYAFADKILPGNGAVFIVSACYIIDQMLTAVGMARATYLKKIAVSEEDVSPTLSAGISLDHIVSMTVPFLGGYVWYSFGEYGYKYVFIAGAVVAVINLISVSRVKISKAEPPAEIAG